MSLTSSDLWRIKWISHHELLNIVMLLMRFLFFPSLHSSPLSAHTHVVIVADNIVSQVTVPFLAVPHAVRKFEGLFDLRFLQ